jgi:DNA-directed RNA polymerase specialized sigma24 family protein
MDESEKLRLLEEQIEAAYPRLRKYVGFMTSDRGLPPGYGDPDDLIHEAVGRLIDGSRRWDPSKYPVGSHLRWILKSMLSGKGVYQRERNKPLGNIASGVEPQPENEKNCLLSAEEAEERWNAVKEEIGDDKEALDYIEAVRLGVEKPADIAEITGIAIERVYELPRKFKRLGPAISARLKASRDTETRR